MKKRLPPSLLACALIVLLAACEPPPPPPTPQVIAPTPVVEEKPEPSPHEAVRTGNFRSLQHWFDDGIDVDLLNERGATLLHEAAAAGQSAMAVWLIELGANLEREDQDGYTPVQLAAMTDKNDLVDLLLHFGASFDVAEETPWVEEEADDEPVVELGLPEDWKDLEFRIWTSARGEQVEAAFIEMQQDLVILGSRQGLESRVPINQLSRDDQILARQLSASQRAMPAAGGRGGPTRVRTGFSSECERLLIRAIQRARQEVLVAIYTITRPQIEQALSTAARRGVKVQVKYDAKQARQIDSMQTIINRLRTAGVELVPIDMSGRYASMHHKFTVIDQEAVFTGSYNYTITATTTSYENCVLIESADVARDFQREFKQVRSR